MSRSRGWIVVINNYDDYDIDCLLALTCRYMCFGFEVGKNGTPHIQGFVYMYNPKTLTSMKKKLPRAHLEAQKGSILSIQVYTSKDDDWYEFGDRPTQGKAKWEQIEDVMNDPTSNPHLFNQYNKMYRQLTLSRANN